ncbi:MAG: hypothetical protein M1822_000466 [Bathelium mastoideum]|nr:MAG: hypothetical protein M1822_000466 [Bathelium mastoideum]
MKTLSATRSLSFCTNTLWRFQPSGRAISAFSAIGKSLRQSRAPPDRKKRERTPGPYRNSRSSRPSAGSTRDNPFENSSSRNTGRVRVRQDAQSGASYTPINSQRTSVTKRRDNDFRGRNLPGGKSPSVQKDVGNVPINLQRTSVTKRRDNDFRRRTLPGERNSSAQKDVGNTPINSQRASITKRRDNDFRRRTLPGESDSSARKVVGSRSDSYWGMPYTTAASDFLFGYSTVKAALKARKRKFYKLYVHERALRRDSENGFDSILKTAKESGVTIRHVDDSFLGVMDKKTKNRPHNGLILEASPLPVLPVMHLGGVARHNGDFTVEMDFQSAEEKVVNGTDPHVSYNAANWRNPFVLFLYEIQNEGNMGAIIRTAYYLGVDAVAIHDRSTASISSGPTLKASSGAAEALPILRVGNVDTFLSKSAEAGWRIYASVAPSAASSSDISSRRVELTTNSASALGFSSSAYAQARSETDASTSPPEQFNDLALEGNSIDSDPYALATTLDPSNPVSSPLSTQQPLRPSSSRPLPLPSTPNSTPTAPQSSRVYPLTHLGNPTLHYPSILVLGGEHTGISRRVLSRCHTQVCIEAARARDEVGVDSLNVAVAAGMMVQRFVQRPRGRVRVGVGDMVA